MNLKTKRIISVFCAVATIAALFSGCKKTATPDSEYSVIEEIIDVSDSEENTSDSTSKDKSSKGSTDKNNDSKKSNTDNKHSQANSTGDGSNALVDPKNYKGTTVTFATWQYADGIDTDAAISAFKKKYGITVKTITVPQKTYVQEITALINSGNAPDVIRDWEYWPSFTTIAQPLENAKIDLSDSIWDQNALKLREVNGKHYSLISVGGMFNGPSNIVYYNKKLLNSNGIKTPEDYKNIGKWNFDALYQIAKSSAAIGNGYKGIYADNFGGMISSSFGTDIFKYSNGKFSSGVSDPMLATVWQNITKWNKEGLMAEDRSAFINGKCGIAIANGYGLKKSGYWRDMNAKDIGYIELPELNGQKPQTASNSTFFGICKGAKNPIAGGIFLRYYLDANNYNISKQFISSEAANYIVKASSALNANTFYNINTGIANACGIDNKKYYYELYQSDTAQVSQVLSAMSNEVNGYVKNTQKVLDQNTK